MDDLQFFRIAKALADPRRFEVLERIGAQPEASCAGLNECMDVSAATISHHIRELADAGLVEIRKEGKFGYLKVRRAVLDDYLRHIRKKVNGR